MKQNKRGGGGGGGENSEKRKHEDKCAQARLFLANKLAHSAKHTKRFPPFSRKEKLVVSKQLDFNVLLFEQGDLRTKKVVSKQLDFNVLLFEQGDLRTKKVVSKQLDFNVLLFEQGDLRTKEEEMSKQLDFNVLLTKSVSNLVFYAQSTSVLTEPVNQGGANRTG